jgi:hypothetical protein
MPRLPKNTNLAVLYSYFNFRVDSFLTDDGSVYFHSYYVSSFDFKVHIVTYFVSIENQFLIKMGELPLLRTIYIKFFSQFINVDLLGDLCFSHHEVDLKLI